MRFFTIDWWLAIQEGDITNPVDHYRIHLELIRDRIPDGLMVLQETVSLHDGNLRESHLDVEHGELRLIVRCSDCSGGLQQFTLLYGGVSSFSSTSDPEIGLPGPLGYGDWGYDEVDVDKGNGIIHRILFSSGIELEVRFATFELRQSHDS